MLRQRYGHVLQRMHGKVDLAQLLCAIQFLGEQAFATGILQRILSPVVVKVWIEVSSPPPAAALMRSAK